MPALYFACVGLVVFPVPPAQSECGKGRDFSCLEAEAVALASAHAEVHGVGRIRRVPLGHRLGFRLPLPFMLRPASGSVE